MVSIKFRLLYYTLKKKQKWVHKSQTIGVGVQCNDYNYSVNPKEGKKHRTK